MTNDARDRVNAMVHTPLRALALTSLAVTVVGVAACSSQGASRDSFEPDQGKTPEPVENRPPPAPTSDSSTPPPPPPQDAGTDAKDDCVRTPPSKKCGLVPQCGCAATETCDVTDGAGNVACVPSGKAAQGFPCTGTQGCARGLTCVFGTCHAFCDKPGSACSLPGTGDCLQVKGQGGAAIPNFGVCLVKCDLRDPLACGGTTAAGTGVCLVDDKGATDCQEGGTRTENQSCSPTDDCGPALVCVSITQSGVTTSSCKKWCRVGTADCGAGKTCGGFSTKVLVGGVEYGACP
jgi:hypothetical protein